MELHVGDKVRLLFPRKDNWTLRRLSMEMEKFHGKEYTIKILLKDYRNSFLVEDPDMSFDQRFYTDGTRSRANNEGIKGWIWYMEWTELLTPNPPEPMNQFARFTALLDD